MVQRFVTLDTGNGQLSTAANNTAQNLKESNVTDSFGRIRTSQTETILELKQNSEVGRENIVEGEISGTGTSTTFPDVDAGSSYITVGTSVGLRRLRSHIAGLYQNGKSALIIMTFSFDNSGEANVIKRVGYFDDNDGIFVALDGTDIKLVLRSNNGFTEEVLRSNWDNPMDNSLEPDNYIEFGDKIPIFWVNFAYLGGGEIECGFIVNGSLVTAHTFNKTNTLTQPYWSQPNLFLTYEIERTVAGGTSQSLLTACGAVFNEGGAIKIGYPIVLSTTFNKNLGNNLQHRLLCLFRLNPLRINARVKISAFLVGIESKEAFAINIVKNPVITPSYTPTWIDYPRRSLQYDWVENVTETVSDAFINTNQNIACGFGSAATNEASSDLTQQTYLSVQVDNTPDVYGLVVYPLSLNEKTFYRYITLLEEI